MKENQSFSKFFSYLKDKFFAQVQQIKEVDYLSNPHHLANKASKEIVLEICSKLVDKESTILNKEILVDVLEKLNQGKSVLLLMEHYSNFDLPGFDYLLRQNGFAEVADKIIAIAGIKLFTEDLDVKMFSSAFNVILIYPPSRILGASSEEIKKQKMFNTNSLKEIYAKRSTNPILMFPSATRYRKGREETKKIIKETANYLRLFDYFVPISICGNILELSENERMEDDFFKKDVLVYNLGEIVDCASYREKFLEKAQNLDSLELKASYEELVSLDIKRTFEDLHSVGMEFYKKVCQK